MNYLKLFKNHSEYESFISGETMMTPDVSHCIAEKDVHYRKKKFDNEYLTFEALESGTFTLTIGSAVTTGHVVSVSYSLDNGETWTTTNNVDGQQVVITTPTVNAGDEVLWKGNANRMANNYGTNSASTFSSTANFNARGNIMSLLYGDEFKGKVSLTGKNYCFSCLFQSNTKLNNAKNISLPATTLASYCYQFMFDGCTSLTTAPELSATTLKEYCYYYMFKGCTSLTVAPTLSATTLADSCYGSMFRNCTSLTTAPVLSATTLAQYCYSNMFNGCTSLTVAPELPATTLANDCYANMFNGCTSLTTAPVLPATTLAQYCYSSMFHGCTSLTTAPELPATTLTGWCYQHMFGGCTSLTTAPVLSATTLGIDCYNGMFQGCTSLTTAPELPATTLAQGCYVGMFTDCTSLTVVPELPATTLTSNCYNAMFYGCTSLTTAPELPATISVNSCYNYMFYGCSKLTTAPELPATTLDYGCYYGMFYGCTSLTTAPELPATTLANYCYNQMFYGCTNLNSITCLATNISATNCTTNWVNGVASSGTFTKHPSMTGWTTGVNGIPEGWETTDFVPSENYLTFDIISSGTIVWKASTTATTVATISYSINNGAWTDITSTKAGTSFNVSDGDKVRFKGNNAGYSTTRDDYNTFNGSTASFNLEGNIMSLIDDMMFDYKTTLDTDYTFNALFHNTNVSNTENLILPATTLASGCYSYMFYGCTSLTTAPELPAITLAEFCYSDMFHGCTSLTTAPQLPATTLARYCYYGMFWNCTNLATASELPSTTMAVVCYSHMFAGCTSLTVAPELPATTLAQSCYSDMFLNCTSLTTAPELPVTTLANGCYGSMFRGCTSLTTAPELPATALTENCYGAMFQRCTSLIAAPKLPATTLASGCYRYMFFGCASLSSITCLATDISATNCTENWVGGVASSGTFIKADGMNDWTRGSNGIPTNWTAEDFYATKYFTTIALESGTIDFTMLSHADTSYITSFAYSKNNGEWVETQNSDNREENIVISVSVVEGDKVKWKGIANHVGGYDDNGGVFTSTCRFNAQGNIMSLLYGDDFKDKVTLENDYSFTYLFSDLYNNNDCLIVNASNLILPAITLTKYCYWYMFADCANLTTAPDLPATGLAQDCYDSMFNGCTSLTTAPELPATTLASSCYSYMFSGCTSLTVAPELPATTLMPGCYDSMFRDCTSLTTAPVLPATTLAQYCYSNMFNGCTALNSITCLATNISANGSTMKWVNGVATSGTFTKAPSMTSWTTGTNGIPTNWTVKDYGAVSTSLVMYVDDFPESKLQDEGETVEYVMNRQLNSSDECLIGNKYVYTGETITYNGNTYYLWEMSDDCDISSNVLYLLTTTDDIDTLYSQSLEDDLTNHFTSLVGRLDEDKEDMYNDGEIGDEYELYLVKVVNNNSASLRIWVDDFPEDARYEEGSAQDKMTAEVEDPEVEGANPYEYFGETIVYNGNIYYLWQAVEGYNVDNSNSKYFATTTIDFNTLYSQSLEDDLTNHFTDAIGMFNDSKSIYAEQGELPDGSDAHYLVKVEDLS